MTVLQSVGWGIRSGNFGYQRLFYILAECKSLFVFFRTQRLGNQSSILCLLVRSCSLYFANSVGNKALIPLLNFGYIVLTERNVGTVHVGKELQGVAVYGNRVNGDVSYGYFFSCSGIQKLAYFPAGFCRKLLRTARLGDKGGGKAC